MLPLVLLAAAGGALFIASKSGTPTGGPGFAGGGEALPTLGADGSLQGLGVMPLPLTPPAAKPATVAEAIAVAEESEAFVLAQCEKTYNCKKKKRAKKRICQRHLKRCKKRAGRKASKTVQRAGKKSLGMGASAFMEDVGNAVGSALAGQNGGQ